MAITHSCFGLEGRISGHHRILLRASRADLPSHGEGGWTSRGWGSFILNSLLLGRFGGLVMENVEGLVEGGGHGHHPLFLKTRRTDSPSHGEVCSVSERCACKVANKDVLVRRRSYGLIRMANLAMAGGLPFYS